MRQLTLKVPDGKGQQVLEMARQLKGKNLSEVAAGAHRLVTVHLNNKEVSAFLEKLEQIPEAEITLIPRGVIALYPPPDQVPDQVTSVARKSAIEIYLSGLQSVGSRMGMAGYAIFGGAVVWIGLYTNTMYLLTAAMLLAPFAGPAMNAALATSAGDWSLLRKSLGRYFISIAITIATSFLLSLVFGLQHPTIFMAEISQISQVSVLLPLVAGLAGSLNLIQAERDSLVSGAAVGVLVAASLAPPAGIVGMALAIGRWDLAKSGLFLLLLQLVGINLSASLLFRYYGSISTSGARFFHGKKMVYWLSLAFSGLAVAGLLFWQLRKPPYLERSSYTGMVSEEVKTALQKELPEVEAVQVQVEFTRSEVPGMNPVLCRLYLLRQDAAANLTDEELKERVIRVVDRKIKQNKYNLTPLYDLTLLRKGAGAPGEG